MSCVSKNSPARRALHEGADRENYFLAYSFLSFSPSLQGALFPHAEAL